MSDIAAQSSRQHRRRDEALVHGLRDERNHRASAARRPRWIEAGAPPRAVRDAHDGARVEPCVPQVRQDRRRGDGQLPPHGDASIYDTLVRLAQDFNMRYPLVDGQGNFGSIDGDPPAAMRYTEARPEPLAEAMMTDLDKETVDFVPNYDETTEEPTVLPTTFPNLLVNGSAGIAVGMATNIPPHNMREVIDGVIAVDRAPRPDEGGAAPRRAAGGSRPRLPDRRLHRRPPGHLPAPTRPAAAPSPLRAKVDDRGERRRATSSRSSSPRFRIRSTRRG